MTLKNNWQTGDIVTAVHLNAVADEVNDKTATGQSLLTAVDAAAARMALGTGKVVTVSQHVASTASFQAAIVAAITAAGVNGVVDFEGVSYVTTGAVTVSTNGVTLQNGGVRPTGMFPALTVTGNDVTVRNMVFSRSQSRGVLDSTPARCCVAVSGLRFGSYDCDYLATNLACVYLANGVCDGAVISGGRMTGAAAVQSGCGVLAASGALANSNITVTGVHMHDMTDGVLLFDTGDSLVSNNRVEHLRILPTVTLTGWTNVTGTIWKQRTAAGTPGVDGVSQDREDGVTVLVTINGTKTGVQSYDSTSPTSNRATLSNGFVYVNLATDPNAATITSDITSGYAYMVYTTGTNDFCSGNRFIGNVADDCDGFGIYFQLASAGVRVGNQAIGNVLTGVCLQGVQTVSLPFGGIGVVGGFDTLLESNSVDVVGSSGKAAPGVTVWMLAEGASGSIVSNTVANSFGRGFDIRSSNYAVTGCHARSNASDGFFVFTNIAAQVIDNVSLVGCHSRSNGSNGFGVDGSTAGIGSVSARIIGGSATLNANRGIIFNSAASSATIKDSAAIGVRVSGNSTTVHDQVSISGMNQGTIVANCHLSHTVVGAKGVSVAAAATDTVVDNNQYDITTPETLNGPVRFGGAKTSGAQWRGTGSPEGVVTAPVGSIFQRTDGAAATALYIKETGTGNTGWAAASTSAVKAFYDSVSTTMTNKTLTSPVINTPTGIAKGDVGLGSVDNTADSAKSVSSAATLTTARNIDGQSFNGSANITVIAPGTNAATGKTTPADADAIPLVDSAASNVLKKLTISDLKTAVRTPTDVQVFTSSGTWTKPAGALSVHVRCIAGGGGGGAGARGPSGTALSGGGGGGGGGMCEMTTPASDLTPDVAVTVGAGAAGATGQTVNGTAGANGTAGTRSQFGAYLFANGGGGGVGGGLAAAGTAGGRGLGQFAGSAGGAGSATGAAGAIGTATQNAAGGAGGGGITTAPAATAGGVGGFSETANLSGGTAGNAANGGNGNSGGAKTPGSGGGGGGASTTVAGFNGGTGGTYGGGGGGGGASLDGNSSGSGGTGGPGICVVTTYF